MPLRGAVLVLFLIVVGLIAAAVSRAAGLSINWVGWLFVGIPAVLVLGSIGLVIWGKVDERVKRRRTLAAVAASTGGQVVTLNRATRRQLRSSLDRRAVAVPADGLDLYWASGRWRATVPGLRAERWLWLDTGDDDVFSVADLSKKWDTRFANDQLAQLLNARRIDRLEIGSDTMHIGFAAGVPRDGQVPAVVEVARFVVRLGGADAPAPS